MNILRNIFDIIFKLMFVIIGIKYVWAGEIISALLCIIILGIAEIIDKLEKIIEEMRKK